MMQELKLGLVHVAPGDQAAERHYAELTPAYLGQLVGPMDDMWMAFSLMAQHHLLYVGAQLVGRCALDEEGKLLGFFVEESQRHRAPALLRHLLGRLQARCMLACTLDPGFLSVAMDVAASVEPEALLYAHTTEPSLEREEPLLAAAPRDHTRLVEFYQNQTGGPLEFLQGYVQERIERQELWLVQPGAGLQAIGELRVDKHQPGIAHLGFIVREEARGQGLGTRLLGTLVQRSLERQLAPHCSTDMTNHGAQRAIERAGFRSSHRVLRISYAL